MDHWAIIGQGAPVPVASGVQGSVVVSLWLPSSSDQVVICDWVDWEQSLSESKAGLKLISIDAITTLSPSPSLLVYLYINLEIIIWKAL